MPSQVNVKGMVTRRPGVYSIVDASALSGNELDINNVAIVGQFEFLKQATPKKVSTFRRMAELQFSDTDLMLLASILYNPASDDRITGGPNSTTLVNVSPTTQASNVFNDSNGTPSVKLKSAAWGVVGNRVICKIGSGTSNGQKFTILRDGRTEVFDDVGLDEVVSFEYTAIGAGAATATSATMDNVGGLTIVNKKSGLSATFTTTDLAFDGTLKINLSAPLAGAETIDYVVTGTNKDTGAPDTENVALTAPTQTVTTSKKWSAITSVAAVVGGGYGGTWELEANAFSLSPSEYTYASDLVSRVNSHSAYTALNLEPQASAVKVSELDNATSADLTTPMEVDANVYSIIQALKNSELVVAEKPAGSVKAPANTVSDITLSGGSQTTPSLSDWQSALESLETESIQILVGFPQGMLDVSGVSGVHTAVKDHCIKMAGEGGSECNAWVGCPADETFAEIQTRTKALNSRFVSLVFQDATVVDPNGNQKEISPSGVAVMCAGMQAGTNVGVPLTSKRPNVVSVAQNENIKPNSDANQLLANGMCFFTSDRLGPKMERSITTYLTDDNPIFSEMSANESVNTSIRDLRENLKTLIGDPATITTKGRIKSLTLARLNNQVSEEIIKAFVDSSVTVEDLGDTFKVSYQVAPIEPVNFIVVTAMVQRISA